LDKTGPAALNALQRKGEWQKIGRQEHRDAFCRHCKKTYAEYDPKTLPWPELDDKALKRLRAVPATACGRAAWSPRPP
jgi:lipocalin